MNIVNLEDLKKSTVSFELKNGLSAQEKETVLNKVHSISTVFNITQNAENPDQYDVQFESAQNGSAALVACAIARIPNTGPVSLSPAKIRPAFVPYRLY